MQTTKTTIEHHQNILNERLEIFNVIMSRILEKPDPKNSFNIPPLDLNSNLGCLINDYNLDFQDELLLLFCYSWEFCPTFFLKLLESNEDTQDRLFYGGKVSTENGIFIPSFQTFLTIFINKEEQISTYSYFTSDKHPFNKYGIIEWTSLPEINNHFHSQISISPNFLSYIHGGEIPRIDHETGFPARYNPATLPLKDIVLNEETHRSLEVLSKFLSVKRDLPKHPNLLKKFKTSHIAVFEGPPGTGKSLTASSLGEEYDMPTYTLDLSRVISKYIGDFEKAMEKVFSRLDGLNCILFIDEADSLFSKRNEEVKETKDKYANQEMSYLLQRIEKFDGIVILATNVNDIRRHIDKAMMRRISYLVPFPFPSYKERLQIWEKSLPDVYSFSNGVTDELAMNYQLSGANISSIISSVLIDAFHANVKSITKEMLLPHIQKEFYKRDSPIDKCPDNSPGAFLMAQRLGRDAVHNGRRM